MRMKAASILALAALAACGDMTTLPTRTAPPEEARLSWTPITWAGRTWYVKSGNGLYPGPNNWSSSNVWVDGNGYLHLKISKVNNTWYGAELGTADSLGFGTYQWWVEGRVDLLDPNVVLGLFQYNGPDGRNELDIEFSRWGWAAGPNASYSAYPSATGYSSTVSSFTLALEGTFTTQRYKWEDDQVYFQTLGGHRNDNVNQINSWTFAPTTNAQQKVPQNPMPVRMNLWLMNGTAPSDGQEVEVVIRSFTYTPL